MRVKFAFIFFWSIGIAVLYILIHIAVASDERIILTDFQNPLIKYSLPLFGVNVCIVLLLNPILMHLGVITPHYYHADKYSQAKANFILLSLSGPGWIFLAVAIYHLAVSIKPLFILGVLLAFIYLSSIITLLKHNK